MPLDSNDQTRHHSLVDPHVGGRWLSDVVLGAQDGLVNTLGVVLAVAAASGIARVVLASGLAAAFAESVSMAAVAYTSSRARGDLFESERQREYRHVRVVPDLEREEIRAIYAAKGFRGELLDRVVDTICANADVWVAVMMAEEHGLTHVSRRAALRSSVVVGVAALVASVIPVAPFLGLGTGAGVVVALAVGAATLFVLGAFKAKVTVGRLARSGIELVLIGLGSAALGYLIGALLGAQP